MPTYENTEKITTDDQIIEGLMPTHEITEKNTTDDNKLEEQLPNIDYLNIK